jgi:oligoendopeptidase F
MVTTDQPPHWDLRRFFPQARINVEESLELLEKKFGLFADKRKFLEPAQKVTAEQFLSFLGELKEIEEEASLLSGYASLAFAQDTSDQKAQSILTKVEAVLARLENSVMFFHLWWKGLPEDLAQPLLEAATGYKYMLARSRAFGEHTLSEAEEKVINFKNLTGHDLAIRLYDTVTNGYSFDPFFLPPEMRRPLNREELMVYVRSYQPELRSGAYKELYRVYGEAGPLLGQIFQGLTHDWFYEEVVMRHHASPRSARNKLNDLQEGTVESLLRVCQKKVPEAFGRYFKGKAKRLGLDVLKRYDLYAPLKPFERTFTFPEGLREVELAFRSFDDEFADLAMKIGSENHLSAITRPHKQGGAFCASFVPGAAPWVLMSFTGERHDLFTLAHELGHAVHSLLAKDHNIFEFHSALPMAETASTFGEMLMTRRFIETCDDGEKEAIMFGFLDNAYATVGRQAFFSLFEYQAHQMVKDGATPDELSEAYLANLKAQFGDSVEVSDEFRWEWVSIPHFYHAPFYVYAYSFGQLLVYSLWNLYLKEGEAFVPKMKSILAKGGSASPETILSQAGLGPLDDDFWLGGFEVIESFMPEF